MRILTIKGNGEFNAGPKAPSDIIDILKKNYGAESELLIQSNKKIDKVKYRLKIAKVIRKAKKNNEVLVLQFPMYETTKLLNSIFLTFLGWAKKERTGIIIHDIEGLRNKDEVLLNQDIARFNKVGYVIVHNDKMKKVLEEKNVKSNLYTLELFDYLCDKEIENKRKNNLDAKMPVLAYAGNLAQVKSPYIYQLEKEKMNFKINLYGVGIEKDINEKLQYKGKFPPNELPDKLEADLGLIWDGNYDESDENEGMRNYTKYNNPHKMSCYMAAGLPVIVWRKAAIAEFVKKYNVGYTVSNLYEINNLDFSDYQEKLDNVSKIQEKVRSGYYTKTAMDKVLKEIERNEKNG